MRPFNFSPGPSMLPDDVLKIAQKEMLDWRGLGMSAMEIGHRTPDYSVIIENSISALKKIIFIPDNYDILFLSGGATTQFFMVPMNLLASNPKADYVDTGVWSAKAYNEATRYGDIQLATTLSQIDQKQMIPKPDTWACREDAAYLYYTPNETISGIQFHDVPPSKVPLVADMSSMFLSEPIDVSKFGIIFACAQKNLGQAGITLVIIRKDLIQEAMPFTPSLLRYSEQAKLNSLANTPPTYSWYFLSLMLEWILEQGGIPEMHARSLRRSAALYDCIDQYPDFYLTRVHPECRSTMNVTFNLPSAELTDLFLKEAKIKNLINLKGHRLQGGIRASLYNGMPEEGAYQLAELMKQFVHQYGGK